MAERIDGVALGVGAAGGLLVYAGIKGKSVPSLVQAVIRGQSPGSAPADQALAGSSTGGSFTGAPVATTGAIGPIASDAAQYAGHCYSYGGHPGTDGRGCWDCSSFVNWVVGHDLGLSIPGYPNGKYDGSSHGPPTGVWLLWSGLRTIGNGGSMQPGDLAIWQTHMGIVTGDNEMISAQNEQDGTRMSTVRGFIPGEILFIRRYRDVGPLANIGSAGPH